MSDDQEEWTCGKGVAASAALPEQMAKLLTAVAGVLRNHERSLDSKDPSGQQEIAAYRRVVAVHRRAAEQLLELAETMASYRDLPIADHDVAVLVDAKSLEAMAAFVDAEESLLSLLRDRAAEHRAMLEQMERG